MPQRKRILLEPGAKYGRLTIIENLPTAGFSARVRCACDCGKEHVTLTRYVIFGRTKSCGCLSAEMHNRVTAKKAYEEARRYKEEANALKLAGLDSKQQAALTKNEAEALWIIQKYESMLADPLRMASMDSPEDVAADLESRIDVLTAQYGLFAVRAVCGSIKKGVGVCCAPPHENNQQI